MSHRTLRRRALAGAAAALTLALAGSVVSGGGPAASAPVADCATPYPVSDLVAGASVHGLTVTSGTTPQAFTGQVLGVVTDGINPGVDMVMVRVDPTGLDIDRTEVQGIWQGMSGSPVYAADGRLIGAVAYGLADLQQSWVAGVTPFEDMDEYLTADKTAGPVKLDARTASKLAAAAGISRRAAAQGFVPLPESLAVAGVPARFLHPTAAQVAANPWLRTDVYAAGKAGPALTADSIVAGGNVAAAMAHGEILMGGVGTATSVCNGKVVAFGHPAGFYGDTSMTLHPADVVYVQGSVPSFKVANIGAPVGTVFGDHLTGITGSFGALPEATTLTTDANWGARNRSGTTDVTVRSSDVLAYITFLQTVTDFSTAIDGAIPGSSLYTWTVSGTDATDAPFALSWTDRYVSRYDIAGDLAMTVANYVQEIGDMEGVTIDSIAVGGDAMPSTTSLRLSRIEQNRHGSWVRVTDRHPALATAGGTLAVRAVFTGGAEDVTVPFTFAVPKGAAGRIAGLAIAGGQSTYLSLGSTPESADEALGKAVRSDVVRAQFGNPSLDDVSDYYDGGFGYDGEIFKPGGHHYPQPVRFTQTQRSEPAAAVMSGFTLLQVVIR